LRAKAYYNLGKIAEAVADFDQAADLGVSSAEFYADQAMALAKHKDLPKAVAAVGEAIRLAPTSELHLLRARLFRQQGQLDKAIADFRRALDLGARDPEAYCARATYYFSKGQYEEAIADYDVAIELDPKSPPLYTARAKAYYEKGDFGHAEADSVKAKELRSLLR
jgi:tetratricopeptide (TPR) repeat protein